MCVKRTNGPTVHQAGQPSRSSGGQNQIIPACSRSCSADGCGVEFTASRCFGTLRERAGLVLIIILGGGGHGGMGRAMLSP